MIQVRLKDLLAERGRTRYWLAHETGLQFKTLARIDRAESTNRIELNTLDKICRALQCQPGDLLVWLDDKVESRSAKKSRRKGK
jgi:putative transcriptional regulator